MKKYVAEAQSISQFSETPGIVSVKDFFYENETAYIVMEYIEGQNLKDYLKDRGGLLPEAEALQIIKPVVNALAKVHEAGIIHRDISPDNIMLTFSQGKIEDVKLIDFGAARMTSASDQKSLTIILKHGYAPEEQYRTHGEQGPWTDVYAVCAVLYRMLTGKTPVPAMDRLFQDELQSISQMGIHINKNTDAAIMKGLAVKKENRIQTTQELIDVLYHGGKISSGNKEKKKGICLAAGTVAAVLLVAAIFLGSTMQGTNETAKPQEQEKLVEETEEVQESETVSEQGQEVFVDTQIQEEVLGEQIVFYHPQKSISASDEHILFCMQDGTVQAIGQDEYGECDVDDWTHVAAVVAGNHCSFGIRTDGTVLYAGDEAYKGVELWKDIVDIGTVNLGVVGLKKDGTLVTLLDEEYLEFEWSNAEEVSEWTKIKAIASNEYNVYGLGEDGTVWTTDSAFQEHQVVSGWEDVEYITVGFVPPYTTVLCGLGKDQTVKATYVVEEQINDLYMKDLLKKENVIQVDPRVVVFADGTVAELKTSESGTSYGVTPQEAVKEWTNVQAAAYYSGNGDCIYALTEDGTILCSSDGTNMGNAELEDFTNLEWIQLVVSNGCENLIGYTKDGKLICYGKSVNLPSVMLNMGVGIEDYLVDQVIQDEIRATMGLEPLISEELTWLSDGIYEKLCEQLSKLKYCDGNDYWLKEDGTLYLQYSGETYKNVEQILENPCEIILKKDGTVKIIDQYLEEYYTNYLVLEEWTEIVQLINFNNNILGLKKDGNIVSYTYNEAIENLTEKMKYLVSEGQSVIGITQEGQAKVIIESENAMTKDRKSVV